MRYDPIRVGQILGLSPRPSTYSVMEAAIRAGFPKAALYNVTNLIESEPGNARELAYAVVPKSTLSRRETLTPEQSERTERLARLFAQAEQVFGDANDARDFMHRAHPELEGRRPLDVAATELGARNVERVLNAAEFGLPV